MNLKKMTLSHKVKSKQENIAELKKLWFAFSGSSAVPLAVASLRPLRALQIVTG